MAGLSATLEVGKQSMLNSQVGMQTASHNIANAENTNFARQRVRWASNRAYEIFAGWQGGGASITEISQQRDRFLERSLMNAVSRQHASQARMDTIERAEVLVAPGGEQGLNGILGEFWEAWDGLHQNPEGLAEQNLVVAKSAQLAEGVAQVQGDLDELYGEITKVLQDEIQGKVLPLLERIADLNQEIRRLETPNRPANDLRDERYGALMELVEFLPIEVSEQSDHSVTVTLGQGTITLVEGDTFVADIRYDAGLHNVTFEDINNPGVMLSTTLDGGRFQGWLQAATDIDGYRTDLDAFAATLVQEVNTIHGTPVFALDEGDLALDAAFNQSTVNGAAALDMASLQNQVVTFPPGGPGVDDTFSAFLGQLQQQIGLDRNAASGKYDFQSALIDELRARQQSFSGVSLEEEMVDMLQYQHTFNAAGKVVQVASEMLDTVINLV